MPITLKNVEYVYAKSTPFEKKALDNINLQVKEGEFLTILGKTGSGKSTLIQLMNGVIKPTIGEVRVDGLSTNEKSDSVFDIRRKVGIVFQYPEHQFFEENVLKEISFGPMNFGMDETRIKELVVSSIKMVGLDPEVLFASPFSLSGGEKRKVAIASIIACDPKYLIFDEPTSGLDPISVKRFSLLAKKLQSVGKTVVVVTHSVEFALKNSDRIIVLSNGKIVFEVTKEHFKDPLKLEEIERYDLLLPDIYKLTKNTLNMNFSNKKLDEPLSFLRTFLSVKS
ncbi:ATP-binding cassette domain-containing protein [Mesoaciditoga lauensis]|uniref:ATP-binding cassette domain-containing protein n=1 Tax=Mesoaciditoga lauensis TaxID=1495039 RepID=UPI00056345CD|nr:ATP-binding cassette domain-containing protein [Mesoaciditoga lauensis]